MCAPVPPRSAVRLRSAPTGPSGQSWRSSPAAGAICAGSELRADARAGFRQVAALVHKAALLPAMGCSSSALNKAGDGSRLRSGEQGTQPHPRPGLGIRVGLLPGGPKGATGVRPARQGAGCSLRTGVHPERCATPSGKPERGCWTSGAEVPLRPAAHAAQRGRSRARPRVTLTAW